ncbi:hypothetical protein J2X31_000123 [Flavobacterium arsenatis]|uniref:Uncharacterized protein n=1 Tax=Flavobacterium arsenatis TaxID=1484332 RepID=A0ABU1TJH4_9FLAO|nr:hypothetical protein [Flavobacterium arsenatis]MDR6966130.1 hypothetical protein [Flavobacterium arsenatis]
MDKDTPKIDKLKVDKLLKAVSTLNSFTTLATEGNEIYLDDLYKIVPASEKKVTFSLSFQNVGVATTTKAYLESELILPAENGSIDNCFIEKNTNLRGKTLSVFSYITTTNLSSPSLPFDFKASLVIKGGKSTIKFPIANQVTLQNVGDSVSLKLTLFFY